MDGTVQQIYDHADDPIWEHAVYRPIHDGWRFANIGGSAALEFVADFGGVTNRGHALELCSGGADTCRYLARTYGCHVTGVEANKRQVQRARSRVAGDPAVVRDRIELIEADVTEWRPGRKYDVVYELDSFSLLPDWEQALDLCRICLRPGGRVVLFDLVAGSCLSSEFHEFAKDTDGFAPFQDTEFLVQYLGDIGFQDIAVADQTQRATRCFERIHELLCDDHGPIALTVGSDTRISWQSLAKRYLVAFRGDELKYVRLSAIARS